MISCTVTSSLTDLRSVLYDTRGSELHQSLQICTRSKRITIPWQQGHNLQGTSNCMPSLPELIHHRVESVVLFRRSVPYEVLPRLQHVLVKLRIMLRRHRFKNILQLGNVQGRHHKGKFCPVQDVLEGKVIIVCDHHRNTPLVHGVPKTRCIDFKTFHVKAELAGQQTL